MNPHPYDLIIGLDRSDKKADLCLITTTTGQRRSAEKKRGQAEKGSGRE